MGALAVLYSRVGFLFFSFSLVFSLSSQIVLAAEKDPAGLNEECKSFLQMLPGHFQRDWVTVPEDWNQPNGQKIQVFYYYRNALEKATNQNSKIDTKTPIVFFNGGPGGSSHGAKESLEVLSEIKKVPFVYIDQRGNGCSDSYPAGNDLQTAKRMINYGTRAIVKDAEAIREIIFGKNSKWKIFGQSYGGMVVQRYLTLAPQSVAAAYSHGYSIMKDQAEWMKFRILSQNRVLKDYFKTYPEDEKALQELKAKWPQDLCVERPGARVCGLVLVDGLRAALGFQSEWEFMHYWISEMSKLDMQDRTLPQAFSDWYVGHMLDSSFATSVVDRMEIGRGQSDRELCIDAMKRLKNAGDDSSLWPINECRLLIAIEKQESSIIEQINDLDILRTSEVLQSLQFNPQIRFFMYSGEKDVFVPVATFREEVSILGDKVKYHQFRNSGHEGFHTEKAILNDLIH